MFTNSNILAVFDSHNCTQNDFIQLLKDSALMRLQSVDNHIANEKIRMMFNEMCGIPADNKDITIAKKALRRDNNIIMLFEMMEEVLPDLVISGWPTDPFFNAFVETRNLARGDSQTFYVPDKTILNVSKVSGDHWDIRRQRLGAGENFTVALQTYAVAVYAEFARLMIGAESWADLVAKIAEAFTKKINDELYVQFQAASSQLPAGGQWTKNLSLAAAATSRDQLLTLVEDVQTASGAEAVILGVKGALGKLRALGDTQWISNEMKQELHTTGRLGFFEGVKLVEIPQSFVVNTTTRQIDPSATSLFVMPATDNKFIKLIYSGDALIKEATAAQDNQDMTNEYYFIQRYGIATVIRTLFGAVTLTA